MPALPHAGELLAVPVYESAPPNSTEGGGTHGTAVVLMDVNTATPRVATAAPGPARFRPHGSAWTPDGGLLVTAQLLNKVRMSCCFRCFKTTTSRLKGGCFVVGCAHGGSNCCILFWL